MSFQRLNKRPKASDSLSTTGKPAKAISYVYRQRLLEYGSALSLWMARGFRFIHLPMFGCGVRSV